MGVVMYRKLSKSLKDNNDKPLVVQVRENWVCSSNSDTGKGTVFDISVIITRTMHIF